MTVDMSAHAVTTRLKRISQLRRLVLSLQKAKLPPQTDRVEKGEQSVEGPSKPYKRKKG